jgi:hypothetical protein
MLAQLVDQFLDLLWDVTEPLAGKCPVCAFWRGAILAALVSLVVVAVP